jgi:L-asparagine transporter-like permease
MSDEQKTIAKKEQQEKTEKILKSITVIIVLYFIIYGGVLLDIIPWDKAREFIHFLQNYG